MTRRYDTITQTRYAPKVIVPLPFATPLTRHSPPLKTNQPGFDQQLEIHLQISPPKVNPQVCVMGSPTGNTGFGEKDHSASAQRSSPSLDIRSAVGSRPDNLPTAFHEVHAGRMTLPVQ